MKLSVSVTTGFLFDHVKDVVWMTQQSQKCSNSTTEILDLRNISVQRKIDDLDDVVLM